MLSVAVTVIGKLPVCVGVPARTPAIESVMPVGSVLAVVKFVVPMPPDCEKLWLNAAPAVPVFVTGAVTVIVWQLMVSEMLALPVHPRLSVTSAVKLNVPVCVGMPDTTPPLPSDNPVGSEPPLCE